jgi:hypothetical protein
VFDVNNKLNQFSLTGSLYTGKMMMKNTKLKATLLALSLGLGLSSTAMSAFAATEAQCETAGYQCIQQGNQSACQFLYRYCLD